MTPFAAAVLAAWMAGAQVEVPFRIMTGEEETYLKTSWKDLKKEHEAWLKSEADKARQQE
jgi:hypothetical protein